MAAVNVAIEMGECPVGRGCGGRAGVEGWGSAHQLSQQDSSQLVLCTCISKISLLLDLGFWRFSLNWGFSRLSVSPETPLHRCFQGSPGHYLLTQLIYSLLSPFPRFCS